MATYYRPEYIPGNAMIYTNSFSETFPEESTNHVSVSREIQDSCSWRDQEDNNNNDKNSFPVMMRLGLSSHMETSRDNNNNNNEYATQVVSGFTRTIHNSKYLKAAQELLDEAVNVKKALKQSQPEGDKIDEEEKEKNLNMNIVELPQTERQELQSKLSKLLSISDEVDRRYKQYYHQMQIVASSFDVIAGCGAAKPYTALALQTISKHFRCLKDAISKQILVIRKSLGSDEHDGLDGRGGVLGISRLRNVDQQVKQQRALQRLGVMQPHAWRPQRGLPDSSVLILRAWLFEHFLHPYPKDSDKIMLARQTGLSRGQVSNWFINARVRLWKPMVEEMYKEEFTDALEENSSENTPEITEVQEQQAESNPKTGVASSSSMGQSAVACGGDRFMTRNGSGGMSLTLRIHNSDDLGHVPMSGVIDNYENAVAGSDLQYLNSSNRQHRLVSSQLLHDFVA